MLLRVARLLLAGLLGVSVAVGCVAAGIIPLMFLDRSDVTRRMASSGIDASSALPWLAVMLALIAAIAALAFFFIRHLRSIVDSVSQGDPFIPANAERLHKMAWLTLAIQGLAIPMNRLAVWFDAAPQVANVYHNRNGISAGALILAMTLFILARVFREGTRLRDDAQGMV